MSLFPHLTHEERERDSEARASNRERDRGAQRGRERERRGRDRQSQQRETPDQVSVSLSSPSTTFSQIIQDSMDSLNFLALLCQILSRFCMSYISFSSFNQIIQVKGPFYCKFTHKVMC